MPNNELVLLDQIVAQGQDEREDPLPQDTAFEVFACEQVLKSSDLSIDEVATGLVGGGDDGGIDGVYVFADGEILNDDSEIFGSSFVPDGFRQGVPLTLKIVQAKRTESFTETALDLVASSTARLLDLQETEENLLALYSSGLAEKFGLFTIALERLAIRHPAVRIEFFYATRGRTVDIHPKVQRKANDLQEQFARTATDAVGIVKFLGASELWASASTGPTYTLQLVYQENATSDNSHIALVSLRDYMKFISEDDGSLRRHIFDWNVRDYQGNVKVNGEIRASLLNEASPDFWWLNNGITIICAKASIQGKTYTLDDVQIVNGLQTSYSIYRALNEADGDHFAMDRNLLVRILETEKATTRDRVIRATNSQTSVPEASLRATDEIHRQIERFFSARGWYYDRRKNYYRNLGKPRARIIGIPLLAQTIMAIGLCRPDTARARPSSLLKDDDHYRSIFSRNVSLEVYLWAAKIQKQVDTFLQSGSLNVSNPERTNLRFHLAMLATARLCGQQVSNPQELQELAEADTSLSAQDLRWCLRVLRRTMRGLVKNTGESPDKIAKGRGFVDESLAAADLV